MMVYTTVEHPGFTPNEWNEIKSDDECWFYYPMIGDFACAVIAGTEAPIFGEEALKCLEAVLAIYKSGETGKVVKI